jgi:hypothetical protein
MEEWRSVARHPRYEVSNFGRIRNAYRNVILHGWISDGYIRVKLGRKIQAFVHILVAEAFLGPCPTGQETRHKDGNRGNPHLTNLEYGTRADNTADAYRHGTRNSADDRQRGIKQVVTKDEKYPGWRQRIFQPRYGT